MDTSSDLRIFKTRRTLCETFMYLMKEKTFDVITINELCGRALVRRATFYKHFIDKYDFFSYFVRYYLDKNIGGIAGSGSEITPQSYCIMYFEHILEFVDENKALIDNVLKSKKFSTILDIFCDEIHNHILNIVKQSNSFSNYDELFSEIFATFYVGGIIRILRQWIRNNGSIDKEKLKKNMEELIESFCFAVDD